MTESISYRIKDNEIPHYWNKSMDRTIEVICRRIAQAKRQTGSECLGA
jgi:hypothetical protein